jgi:hypothetical protein
MSKNENNTKFIFSILAICAIFAVVVFFAYQFKTSQENWDRYWDIRVETMKSLSKELGAVDAYVKAPTVTVKIATLGEFRTHFSDGKVYYYNLSFYIIRENSNVAYVWDPDYHINTENGTWVISNR